MRRVIILGSTGSIGTQAVDVIRQNPDKFEVVGLAAGKNRDLLYTQAAQLGLGRQSLAQGIEAACALVKSVQADVILNGITGSQGLVPSLESLKTGATLALANKESLVCGSELISKVAKPGQIVPVDSEHSALAQALRSGTQAEIGRLILTASGGPFCGRTMAELANVTPAEAMQHPTWNMGQVITTNSATLVNKGLEVIEAHLLFGVPYSQIDVVVHPQSMIHSMVEFTDGSTLAQASPPDMRLPIALGLSWPERLSGAGAPIDWSKAQSWSFEPLDEKVFRAVSLAREVGKSGGGYPAVFNAANEEAVAAFHVGGLSFLGIVETVADTVASFRPGEFGSITIETLQEIETWARRQANKLISA